MIVAIVFLASISVALLICIHCIIAHKEAVHAALKEANEGWGRAISLASTAANIAGAYEEALKKIAARDDAYCDDLCNHPVCTSSHNATVIARAALDRQFFTEGKDGE